MRKYMPCAFPVINPFAASIYPRGDSQVNVDGAVNNFLAMRTCALLRTSSAEITAKHAGLWSRLYRRFFIPGLFEEGMAFPSIFSEDEET